jgi:hypothetical protein
MMEYHPKATVLQYVDERRQVLRGGRERDEKMETDVVSGKRPRLAETQACLSVQYRRRAKDKNKNAPSCLLSALCSTFCEIQKMHSLIHDLDAYLELHGRINHDLLGFRITKPSFTARALVHGV